MSRKRLGVEKSVLLSLRIPAEWDRWLRIKADNSQTSLRDLVREMIRIFLDIKE